MARLINVLMGLLLIYAGLYWLTAFALVLWAPEPWREFAIGMSRAWDLQMVFYLLGCCTLLGVWFVREALRSKP